MTSRESSEHDLLRKPTITSDEYDRARREYSPYKDFTILEGKKPIVTSEFTCPICLDLLFKTVTAKDCLHRFCSDCINMALHKGNRECPTCRSKIISKRDLRSDKSFDMIVKSMWPDRKEYARIVQEYEEATQRDTIEHFRSLEQPIIIAQDKAAIKKDVEQSRTPLTLASKIVVGKFREAENRKREEKARQKLKTPSDKELLNIVLNKDISYIENKITKTMYRAEALNPTEHGTNTLAQNVDFPARTLKKSQLIELEYWINQGFRDPNLKYKTICIGVTEKNGKECYAVLSGRPTDDSDKSHTNIKEEPLCSGGEKITMEVKHEEIVDSTNAAVTDVTNQQEHQRGRKRRHENLVQLSSEPAPSKEPSRKKSKKDETERKDDLHIRDSKVKIEEESRIGVERPGKHSKLDQKNVREFKSEEVTYDEGNLYEKYEYEEEDQLSYLLYYAQTLARLYTNKSAVWKSCFINSFLRDPNPVPLNSMHFSHVANNRNELLNKCYEAYSYSKIPTDETDTDEEYERRAMFKMIMHDRYLYPQEHEVEDEIKQRAYDITEIDRFDSPCFGSSSDIGLNAMEEVYFNFSEEVPGAGNEVNIEEDFMLNYGFALDENEEDSTDLEDFAVESNLDNKEAKSVVKHIDGVKRRKVHITEEDASDDDTENNANIGVESDSEDATDEPIELHNLAAVIQPMHLANGNRKPTLLSNKQSRLRKISPGTTSVPAQPVKADIPKPEEEQSVGDTVSSHNQETTSAHKGTLVSKAPGDYLKNLERTVFWQKVLRRQYAVTRNLMCNTANFHFNQLKNVFDGKYDESMLRDEEISVGFPRLQFPKLYHDYCSHLLSRPDNAVQNFRKMNKHMKPEFLASIRSTSHIDTILKKLNYFNIDAYVDDNDVHIDEEFIDNMESGPSEKDSYSETETDDEFYDSGKYHETIDEFVNCEELSELFDDVPSYRKDVELMYALRDFQSSIKEYKNKRMDCLDDAAAKYDSGPVSKFPVRHGELNELITIFAEPEPTFKQYKYVSRVVEIDENDKQTRNVHWLTDLTNADRREESLVSNFSDYKEDPTFDNPESVNSSGISSNYSGDYEANGSSNDLRKETSKVDIACKMEICEKPSISNATEPYDKKTEPNDLNHLKDFEDAIGMCNDIALDLEGDIRKLTKKQREQLLLQLVDEIEQEISGCGINYKEYNEKDPEKQSVEDSEAEFERDTANCTVENSDETMEYHSEDEVERSAKDVQPETSNGVKRKASSKSVESKKIENSAGKSNHESGEESEKDFKKDIKIDIKEEVEEVPENDIDMISGEDSADDSQATTCFGSVEKQENDCGESGDESRKSDRVGSRKEDSKTLTEDAMEVDNLSSLESRRIHYELCGEDCKERAANKVILESEGYIDNPEKDHLREQESAEMMEKSTESSEIPETSEDDFEDISVGDAEECDGETLREFREEFQEMLKGLLGADFIAYADNTNGKLKKTPVKKIVEKPQNSDDKPVQIKQEIISEASAEVSFENTVQSSVKSTSNARKSNSNEKSPRRLRGLRGILDTPNPNAKPRRNSTKICVQNNSCKLYDTSVTYNRVRKNYCDIISGDEEELYGNNSFDTYVDPRCEEFEEQPDFEMIRKSFHKFKKRDQVVQSVLEKSIPNYDDKWDYTRQDMNVKNLKDVRDVFNLKGRAKFVDMISKAATNSKLSMTIKNLPMVPFYDEYKLKAFTAEPREEEPLETIEPAVNCKVEKA